MQLILMQLVQPVLVLVPSLTFWIFVFMAEGMVVGATNWKVGAALLGYWTGKLTTRWTRWPPKWADTTQLRFRASIWGQTHNRVRQPAEPGRRTEPHLYVDVPDLQVDQGELLLQSLGQTRTGGRVRTARRLTWEERSEVRLDKTLMFCL